MQGDVLSPALFSLVVMPALEAARAEIRAQLACEDVDFFAYIDDVTWILPDGPKSKEVVITTLAKHLKTVGAKLKESKTVTLYPPATRQLRAKEEFPEDPDKAKAATAEFIDVLGAPFIGTMEGMTEGGRAAVQQFVYDRMMNGSRGQQHLHRLQRLRDPAWQPFLSAALTVIRKSILPSACYIIRNTPSSLSTFAVAEFDREVEMTVAALLRVKLSELSPSQRAVIALPLAYGGLGIHKMQPIVEDLVRSAASAVEKKEARQRGMARCNANFEALLQSLTEEQARESEPYTAAAASIMLDHLADYNRAQRLTMNTSGRYIFQADSVETGPFLLRLYGMIGHIPKKLRAENFVCAMCHKQVPLAQRLEHGARCECINRVRRHDTVRNAVRAKAIYAIGVDEVRGEEGFHYTDAKTPEEIKAMRSDLSLRARAADSKEMTKVRLDFGITVGGLQARIKMEKAKEDKYKRIKQWTTEPFVFIPAIMSTRGTMQRRCEDFLRYISAHYLTGVTGSYSTARVQAFLGEIQATALSREYTMFLLTQGGVDNRDPAYAFDDILSPPTNSIQQIGGEITERKRRQELATELNAAACVRDGTALLIDEADAADSRVEVDDEATA
jgi:hypothetical protein